MVYVNYIKCILNIDNATTISVFLNDSFKMCGTLLLVFVLIIDHVNCLLACFVICREITNIFAGKFNKLNLKRSETRKLAC